MRPFQTVRKAARTPWHQFVTGPYSAGHFCWVEQDWSIPMGDIYMLKLVNEETLLARPQAELLLDNVSLDGGYITMWWPGYPNWPLPDPWKTAERSGGLGGYDPSDMIRAIDSRLVSMEHRLIEIADVLKDLGYRDQPDEKAERQKEKKAR